MNLSEVKEEKWSPSYILATWFLICSLANVFIVKLIHSSYYSRPNALFSSLEMTILDISKSGCILVLTFNTFLFIRSELL